MEIDYSKIAGMYVTNPVRKKDIDPGIDRLLKEKQRLTFLDKSPDMLAIAREKNPGVRFI